MKSYLKRIHRESKGFTLIELLVVIATLGVLAALVLPNVTGLVGEGQTEGASAELATVQTAMDIMMAKSDLSSVTATTATDNMSSFPTGNALYPDYLRTTCGQQQPTAPILAVLPVWLLKPLPATNSVRSDS